MGRRGGGGDAGEEAGAAGADAAAGRPHASGERPEGGREGFEERRGEGERAAERASHPGQEGAGEPVVVGTGVGGGGRRDRTRGRPLRLLALAVILAVGTVGAHWFGIVDVPGLDRVLASVLGPAGTGVAPTVDTSGPQPTSPVQSQSLLIDVYRDAQAAADVALALQDRLPDRLFGVAPVQRGGDVVHRLLAGPANTPDQAADLREALSQVLSREDPSGWSPQATSLAFVIDELPDLDGARARVQAATGSEVFGYVLEVTYPDGSTAYRVYAGGYSSPEEARALQGILSQAGIGDATFTERRGEVPE
ncbi:MAG: SPOR domain-containing protein [Gemmatimonadota bacterium]